MSWIILDDNGERRVDELKARTVKGVKAAVRRAEKRGLPVLAAYLRTKGPIALARKVYP
jgi:hypothetical protein